MKSPIQSFASPAVKDLARRFFPDDNVRGQVRMIGQALKRICTWYTDANLRRYRARLAALEGRYSGQRCFIMGNGPSLNKTPLEKLAGECVWGLNRCHLLFDRIDWRPMFYVAVDTRVVPDNAEEINALFADLPDTLFFFPLQFRMERILKSAPNTYWYNEISLSDGHLPDGHFSTNVTAFVRSVRTVSIAAMQLAVHLGFNPIYFIGCDTDYEVPETVKFEDGNPGLIVATQNDDIDHFAPNYFGAGKKYHQPYPERMIFSYQQAKRVCDRLGVQAFNATVGGKLEVFPRVEFDSLFEE